MRIEKKFIKFGTGSTETNARDIPANYTATSYTPSQVATEGADKLSAHLKGIDSALNRVAIPAGDIKETSFTALDNQAVAQNVTGLAFANGTVRSFDAIVSIVRGTTYAQYSLRAIQKATSWELYKDYVGDITGIDFSITAAGQVTYTSTSTGATAALKFRAITTSV